MLIKCSSFFVCHVFQKLLIGNTKLFCEAKKIFVCFRVRLFDSIPVLTALTYFFVPYVFSSSEFYCQILALSQRNSFYGIQYFAFIASCSVEYCFFSDCLQLRSWGALDWACFRGSAVEASSLVHQCLLNSGLKTDFRSIFVLVNNIERCVMCDSFQLALMINEIFVNEYNAMHP